ncbi:TPA: hypothetical protein N0F65_011673 [Lagenidium giganteum]|uniref:BED-type domain-containing protein n=1 Tax=Lagenidium giganteum TaxID=4803 RepID=A0AAV2ZDD5_9STRA|nr:TPA: hypothetical protein N0F65_011673 [Lagenidium giganteum]
MNEDSLLFPRKKKPKLFSDKEIALFFFDRLEGEDDEDGTSNRWICMKCNVVRKRCGGYTNLSSHVKEKHPDYVQLMLDAVTQDSKSGRAFKEDRRAEVRWDEAAPSVQDVKEDRPIVAAPRQKRKLSVDNTALYPTKSGRLTAIEERREEREQKRFELEQERSSLECTLLRRELELKDIQLTVDKVLARKKLKEEGMSTEEIDRLVPIGRVM